MAMRDLPRNIEKNTSNQVKKLVENTHLEED